VEIVQKYTKGKTIKAIQTSTQTLNDKIDVSGTKIIIISLIMSLIITSLSSQLIKTELPARQ